MNSTRTSKSRDATSLHPVTKSCPFDLSTAPQSHAHLLLSLPNTKHQTNSQGQYFFTTLNHSNTSLSDEFKYKNTRSPEIFVLTGGVVLVSGGSNQGSGESTAREREEEKEFSQSGFFCFLRYLFFFVSVQRERERENQEEKKI